MKRRLSLNSQQVYRKSSSLDASGISRYQQCQTVVTMPTLADAFLLGGIKKSRWRSLCCRSLCLSFEQPEYKSLLVTLAPDRPCSYHSTMPKAPITKAKPQTSIPGVKAGNNKGKKNGGKKTKTPAGKPRVQVSFEGAGASNGAGESSQRKAEDVKGKGRAEDGTTGDEDVEMTTANVKTDDEDEDQKPDIAKLNEEARIKKGSTTRNEKFLVIAGSYEKNMYGLEVDVKDYQSSNPDTTPPIVKPIFIFPAHLSCIKTVAASPGGGKFLASGSDDEFVKVWDLRRRKEIGSLSQHVGKYYSRVVSVSRSNPLSHRYNHVSRVPNTVASFGRIRRRHDFPLPYKGLGPAPVTKRPLWPNQLYRCPPIRQSGVECWQGQDVEDVGSDAWTWSCQLGTRCW